MTTRAASFDVVVAGGGPAGAATALSLRAHAPELSVAIVEDATDHALRIGETLPPIATSLLDHLALSAAFAEQRHRSTHGTAAAWGGQSLADNDFLYGARGAGWHLDRAAFDAMLLREAAAREATVISGVRVSQVEEEDARWQLTLSDDQSLSARFVVDATGASSGLGRRLGAQAICEDRLIGFTRFYDDDVANDQRTVVEAFADGWWYTASLPGARRVVACMTDSDVARRLQLSQNDDWGKQLALTNHIAPLVRDARPHERVIARSARSRRLVSAAGDRWLAVGDAASSVDPLSSQGITRALRSGIFASYAIGDALLRGRPDAMQRYRSFVMNEFAQYLSSRAKYYAIERRWPSSTFWQRRHAV